MKNQTLETQVLKLLHELVKEGPPIDCADIDRGDVEKCALCGVRKGPGFTGKGKKGPTLHETWCLFRKAHELINK